ncbi:hypothetical protein ARD30_18490 [Bosea thiooxidans]|uniref:Uncharacterized protein n=1 Tax=Bosea thiooxidans TaxID=53254 RepID=A0A0Q3KHT6_9HYPH|nr:hypothetical protein [Bosea thiooxidans]KQK29227.1 hypothetical protein ARD30_18490 [Bosea thiooxidans]SKB40083.1 hypothetical protein SAMN05660750_00587 [Bosea thiooxidans]
MDDVSEAGLDLELSEFGKRLDSRLIARGWNPKAPRGSGQPFELLAKRAAPGTVRLRIEATLPEAAAGKVMALVIEHGLPRQTAPDEQA